MDPTSWGVAAKNLPGKTVRMAFWDGPARRDIGLGDAKAHFFGMGDENCPIRYWDTEEQLDMRLYFLSGAWDVSVNGPNKTPWKFGDHDLCMPEVRLHKDR